MNHRCRIIGAFKIAWPHILDEREGRWKGSKGGGEDWRPPCWRATWRTWRWRRRRRITYRNESMTKIYTERERVRFVGPFFMACHKSRGITHECEFLMSESMALAFDADIRYDVIILISAGKKNILWPMVASRVIKYWWSCHRMGKRLPPAPLHVSCYGFF